MGKDKMVIKIHGQDSPQLVGLKKSQEWTHDMCPRCLQHNEICLHVLQCPAETSRTHWELAINELEETLIDIRTNPHIITAWKSRLLGW